MRAHVCVCVCAGVCVCRCAYECVHVNAVLTQKAPHQPSRSCCRQVTACYGLNPVQPHPQEWGNTPHCGGRGGRRVRGGKGSGNQ